MKKRFALSLFSFLFPLFFTIAEVTDTRQWLGPRGVSAAEELEQKIMCSFEKNGIKIGPTKQAARAKYVSKHLADLLVRISEPEWREPATQHMLAQIIAETGTLKHLVELPSEHASSKMFYKGRGTMQTTHRDNFAKLAGCSKKIQETHPPQRLTWESISKTPPIWGSALVKNPARAMSEDTEQGRFYNAMSSACYFIDTAVRHDEFAEALKCREDACIHEVGVAVNRGPGRLGENRRPLSKDTRLKAFRKLETCFQGSRDSFIGV